MLPVRTARLGLSRCLLASALGLAAPAAAQTACPGGEAVGRVEIERSGAVHLADLLGLLPSLSLASTDGFATRLQTLSGAPVELRLDGRPLPAASLLDDAALAWAPVALASVERAALCPGGARAVLDLQTAAPDRLRLAAQAGNEVGDPGPLRYLDPSLPNVDKLGPDYEAAGRARLRGAALDASVRWRDHLPTHPAIGPRIADVLDGRFPKRKGLGGRVRLAGARWAAGAHALAAEDLPHETALGREVPTRRGGAGAWASATARAGGATLGLDADATLHRLDRPSWSRLPTQSSAAPDWREATLGLGAHAERRRATRRGRSAERVALRLDARRVRDSGLDDGSLAVLSLDGRRTRAVGGPGEPGPAAAQTLALGVSTDGREIGSRASSTLSRRTGRATTTLDLGLARTLAAAEPDLAFWAARGYRGLATAATPWTQVDAPRPRDAGWARLALELPLASELSAATTTLALDAEVRRSSGASVWVPDFRALGEAPAVRGPVRSLARATGTVLSGGATLGTVREWVRAAAFVRGRVLLESDPLFRLARAREPDWRVGAHLHGSADGRLSVALRAEVRGATRWDGWPEPEVPIHAALDLAVSRTLWRERARVQLSGRDVLGTGGATHPLGADLGGRLFVRAEVRL